MKLDKLIKDSKLIERLDKLDPDNASGSKNDGINYWKGKKIITIDEWNKKIGISGKVVQNYIEEDQKIKEALQYFPDDYEKSLFPIFVSEEHIEVAKKWYNHYIELMRFRNNSKYGRSLCFKCLLCPDKEEHGNYVGISRLIAQTMEVNNEKEEQEEINYNSDAPTTTQSLYPCSVLNRFKCPYDRNEMQKKPRHHQKMRNEGEEEQEQEDLNSFDVDDLFLLSTYSFVAESTFIKARKYKSIDPINNAEDVYNALTDRETLDKLLQQGLNENQLKYKDEIVEFFMSIKDYVRIEDLAWKS